MRGAGVFAAAAVLAALALSAVRRADAGDPSPAARGKVLYGSFGCAVCHGENGVGGIKNPNALGGEVPALIKVADGYTPEELKEKILTGVRDIKRTDASGPAPPLFMPPWKKVMSETEAEAIATYLIGLRPESEGEEW